MRKKRADQLATRVEDRKESREGLKAALEAGLTAYTYLDDTPQ